ncbi:hypothetical protein APY04_1951 [Hyphomicrobium sulfonivorans]|uniref:Uncharacterized protein n=1 Tax=Hyphomicrobium sulfonivorans TaxID=121290 RepID=A0A109BEP7_HYPSL|nr:hypothetical protein [Hyphomicrobium sulfonivorans]KWT67386.1 hypothetical protein APY04_1951 [Hyphomicrobium sulfonivorans]
MLQSERIVSVTAAHTGGKASGKWIAHEGFVAEAAVQFDRINGTVARLERELEKARATIAEMTEEVHRSHRLAAFDQSLENSRNYKISELQRSGRDLKTRVERMEGDRKAYSNVTYKSFVDMDRKLAELGGLKLHIDRIEHAARRNEALFLGALALAAAALASRFFI